MSNKPAPHKQQDYISFVRKWFTDVYNNDAHRPNHVIGQKELYQNYYEYCVPLERAQYRLEYDRFARTLLTSKIIDIGGRWQYREDTPEPTRSQIERAPTW